MRGESILAVQPRADQRPRTAREHDIVRWLHTTRATTAAPRGGRTLSDRAATNGLRTTTDYRLPAPPMQPSLPVAPVQAPAEVASAAAVPSAVSPSPLPPPGRAAFEHGDAPTASVSNSLRKASIASAKTCGTWTELCAICLSPPRVPQMTICGHTYCKQCLSQLKQQTPPTSNPRCPECRTELTKAPQQKYSQSRIIRQQSARRQVTPRVQHSVSGVGSRQQARAAVTREERWQQLVRAGGQRRAVWPQVQPQLSTSMISEVAREVEIVQQQVRRLVPAGSSPQTLFVRGRDSDMPVPVRLSDPPAVSTASESSSGLAGLNFCARNRTLLRRFPLVDVAGFASLVSWTIAIIPDDTDYSRAPERRWFTSDNVVQQQLVPERLLSTAKLPISHVVYTVLHTDILEGGESVGQTIVDRKQQVIYKPPFECKWLHWGSTCITPAKGEVISPPYRQTNEQLERSDRYRFGNAVICPEEQLNPRSRGTFQVQATIHWQHALRHEPSKIVIELRNPQSPQLQPVAGGYLASTRSRGSGIIRIRRASTPDANDQATLQSLVDMANRAYTLAYMNLFTENTMQSLVSPPSSQRARLLPQDSIARRPIFAQFHAFPAWTPEQMAADLTHGAIGADTREGNRDIEVVMLVATSGTGINETIVGCLKLVIEPTGGVARSPQLRESHHRRSRPAVEDASRSAASPLDRQQALQENETHLCVGRICWLAVLPERQGQGIATRLLRAAERHCKQDSRHRVRTICTEYYRPMRQQEARRNDSEESGGGSAQPVAGTAHADRLQVWFTSFGFMTSGNIRAAGVQLGHEHIASCVSLWREQLTKDISSGESGREAGEEGGPRRRRNSPRVRNSSRDERSHVVEEEVQHYEIHWETS